VLSTNDGPKSWVAERGVKVPSGAFVRKGKRRAESGCCRIPPYLEIKRRRCAAPGPTSAAASGLRRPRPPHAGAKPRC
jgi:hypothetical protein